METSRKGFKDMERCLLYLIKGGVQSKEFTVAVGLALVFVMPVNLLIGGTVKEVRKQGIGEGILQVKNATGPATPRSVIDRH